MRGLKSIALVAGFPAIGVHAPAVVQPIRFGKGS